MTPHMILPLVLLAFIRSTEADLPVATQDITFHVYGSNGYAAYSYDEFSALGGTGENAVIIAHDWKESYQTSWVQQMKDQIVVNIPYTMVVILDWTRLANQSYGFAAESAGTIGSLTASALAQVSNEWDGLGLGIGAQINGFIGKNTKLGRIWALSPAGPYFNYQGSDGRLQPNDASQVLIVFHTNIEKIGMNPSAFQVFMFGFGFGSVGTQPVQLLFNDGINQPGCDDTFVNQDPFWDLTDPSFTEYSLSVQDICSHRRSVLYFMEYMTLANLPARDTSYTTGSSPPFNPQIVVPL